MLYFFSCIFFVSAISDIFLNIISRSKYSPPSIRSLRSYFLQHSPIISAVLAALTIIITLIPTMLLSKLLFNFYKPDTIKELWKFLTLATPIGYLADNIIYYFQLFGTQLNPYYKLVGAGLWGSLAFVFSIIITFFITSKIDIF